MSGQKGMTGKPLYLKCSRCKRQRDRHGHARTGKLFRTGQERPYRPRGATGRTSKTAYECWCEHCGQMGWYAHADAAKLPLYTAGTAVIRVPKEPDFEPEKRHKTR